MKRKPRAHTTRRAGCCSKADAGSFRKKPVITTSGTAKVPEMVENFHHLVGAIGHRGEISPTWPAADDGGSPRS